jgi:hypothetical protein
MFQTAFQKNAFQNDAFQIIIKPFGGDDAGGHWTKEETKRYKALQKKLRQAEEKRIAALKADQESRKAFIREQVSPAPKVSKRKQSKVELKQEISKEVVNYDALIANLERQKQDLLNAVLIRQAKEQLEQEIAILEAKRLAELDDEESILALFL